MTSSETSVLIVGGGPVGLSAAIELGWRDVPVILLNEGVETAKHPKCNSTNSRSMEHFRRIGIAAEIRGASKAANVPREICYVTRFCGHEFGRVVHPSMRPDAARSWQTPEPPLSISQLYLEPALKRCAERYRSVEVRFGWRMVSFEQRDCDVIATVENVASGERQAIAARYMIGADGARSPVRHSLGIGMEGEDGSIERSFMGGTMLSFFIRAPTLFAASRRRPAIVNWIINHELRGFIFSQDGQELWIAHCQVPAGIDWRSLDGRQLVRSMIGADVDFEIISGGPWTGGLALTAEHYRAGRVFIVGDAAHLFTPLGGFGMNTGIGDVMNLGWKLAAVHRGWAGQRLLDSYETERRPIALRNTKLGVLCARNMSAWELPASIEEAGAAADAARAAFGAFCIEDDAQQYETGGLQFGERYEGSPIVWGDDDAAPPDDWRRYVPLDRPGARAPHFTMPDGRSLYEVMGRSFALLDCSGDGRGEGFAVAARAAAMPLDVVTARPPQGLYRSHLVLVRPDQQIAWRGDDVPADPRAILDRVRGA